MTRTVATTLLLGLLATAAAADPAADDTRALREQATAIAAELGEHLRSELQAAMQAGGPLAAVSVCSEKARPVADAIGARHGWEVGRTSLRVRNPDNAADSWEREVLLDFNSRSAAGEPLPQLRRAELVGVAGHRYFRYMQAIPTGELCTVCHGTAIEPGLAAHIRTLYPDDRATGFTAGELRGAFSLTRRVE